LTNPGDTGLPPVVTVAVKVMSAGQVAVVAEALRVVVLALCAQIRAQVKKTRGNISRVRFN
jgi:hypothetical protein